MDGARSTATVFGSSKNLSARTSLVLWLYPLSAADDCNANLVFIVDLGMTLHSMRPCLDKEVLCLHV